MGSSSLNSDFFLLASAYNAKDAEGVTAKAQAVLDSYTEEEVDCDKYRPLVAKVHSFLGSAAILLEDYDKALEHHQKDLIIGEKS